MQLYKLKDGENLYMHSLVRTIRGNLPLCLALMIYVQFLSSCADRRVPEEIELTKYPEWAPFLAKRESFEGLVCDLDTGLYEFRFQTQHQSPHEYFSDVFQHAQIAGWQRVQTGELREVYRRSSNVYEAADFFQYIELTYSVQTRTILFRHTYGN